VRARWALGDVDAELEQLAVDAGRAPSKIFGRHPADQVADLLGCWRATWALLARLEAPEEALEHSMPDVLLSDVALPGESGHELMRKVAAREGGATLPAAALSGFSREEDRKPALALASGCCRSPKAHLRHRSAPGRG
jgi:CheY-like chemotaxis protein